MPTLKENPADADIISNKLLIRAGMVRKLVSGVYSFLPLGYKVLRNVERITREEMDKAGFQEVLMSAVQPKELWERSGRWADFGPEMFRLQDRNGRDFCLGPTHEEYFTDLVKNELNSYKQLPTILYQIQTKYRDERRPRFGLIRAREFLMKDAYNFDADREGMLKSYDRVWEAYENVFDRMDFDYRVVLGDSGNMGGSISHEFIAITPNGESEIVYCDDCDFAATNEVAECIYEIETTTEEAKTLEKVHTPNVKTIAELEEFFAIDSDQFVKTLLYKYEDEIYAVLIPGNRDLNLIKLSKHLNCNPDFLEMVEEHEMAEKAGTVLGYVGPIGLKESVNIIVDQRVTEMKNFIIGANEADYHYKNANLTDDLAYEVVEDLLNVEAGDQCPNCNSSLKINRGIEVGNIFQLGTKYSKALDATFLDENGKEQPFYMGSHGIGISRIVSALIEQNHDDYGIIWPINVAPYHAIVTVIRTNDEEQMGLGEEIYQELKEAGIDVLIDDRNERAGVKFNDMDLIGIPLRVVVGRRASEGIVEFSTRADGDKIEISKDEAIEKIYEMVVRSK
jgi:prolyl-tRNA synthetase